MKFNIQKYYYKLFDNKKYKRLKQQNLLQKSVELFENKSDYKVIGTRPVSHDGVEKVTGRAVYGADVKVPGLIWGEVLRSTEVHAKIKSIDTSDAEKFPGVIAVMTHDDLANPCRDTTRNGLNDVDREFYNIMAKDKVLYKGHVIAAVAAIDRNTAQEAVRKIKVEYEKLQPITNVDDATAKNAPILLDDLIELGQLYDRKKRKRYNIDLRSLYNLINPLICRLVNFS